MARPIEVIVWGVGSIGAPCIAAIAHLPKIRLVGVKTYSAHKNGVDSGLLSGSAANGIVATLDETALLALRCDCVLYLPRHTDFLDTDAMLLRLLASGRNVVTPLPYHDPALHPDPAFAAQLAAACRQGGTRLIATGVNPDVVGIELVRTLSRLCLSVETVRITEVWPCAGLDQTALQAYGFGQSLALAQRSQASVDGSIHFVRAVCAEAAKTFDLAITSMHFERAFITTSPGSASSTQDQTVSAIAHRCYGFLGADPDTPAVIVESLWQRDSAARPKEQWVIDITGQPNLRCGLNLQTNLASNTMLGLVAARLPPDTVATVAACLHAVLDLRNGAETPWLGPAHATEKIVH